MVPAEKCLTSQRMGPWAGMSHHHTKRNDVTIPPGADLVELKVPLPIRTTNRKAEMSPPPSSIEGVLVIQLRALIECLGKGGGEGGSWGTLRVRRYGATFGIMQFAG
jgi:hypothetical protein